MVFLWNFRNNGMIIEKYFVGSHGKRHMWEKAYMGKGICGKRHIW